MSHPAWVCGLKLSNIRYRTKCRCSHTLRGCVDWNEQSQHYHHCKQVTPCVGVWIETHYTNNLSSILFVTPCVGVWIETIACNSSIFSYRSHPAWVCGLKLPEAWNTYFFVKSHPAWVCGLKLYNLIERTAIAESHPAWVCGLKHILNTLQMYKKVTPCVGVWIETMTRWIRV